MNETTKTKRPVGRPKMGKPHPIDVHVGSRVRLRRTVVFLVALAVCFYVGFIIATAMKN